MPRGQHPNSRANLTNEGRPAKYGDRSKHEVRVSDIGWEGSQVAARAVGCSGVSEMLEKLGRGELLLTPIEAIER